MSLILPRTGRRLEIELSEQQSDMFFRKWGVRELALFGSILRDDFSPQSDVDVLVRFEPGCHPTLFDLAAMQLELQQLLGREVDLLERDGVEEMRNPYRRDEILRTAEVVYAR